MIAFIPLVITGVSMVKGNTARAVIDFSLAFIFLLSVLLMRVTKIQLKTILIIPVTAYAVFCIYLLFFDALNLWTSIWIFTFPLAAIYLCHIMTGIIESLAVFIILAIFMYTPVAQHSLDTTEKLRFIGVYLLITCLSFIYERMSINKNRKEKALKAELAYENNLIRTMQDNIHQGIFLMDRELKILPQYSRPLVSIFSYYEEDLAGKNLLDILSSSLDTKQLLIMKSYFEMIFDKSKSTRVLESVNPLSEFEYRAGNRTKVLSTNFYLLEKEGFENVIIGIVQDISREKEFAKELHAQKEARDREMKDMFDIIQINPLVFKDFIEDAEANFNYINSILKNINLSEKQVVRKFYQNIHAIKANALILGMETFAKKLHAFEDDIREMIERDVSQSDILTLAIKLETLMTERDHYINIVRKIEAFKNSNQVDTILVHTINKAVEKAAAEEVKKVELKAGYLDMGIMESRLRHVIKDILFQLVRNSIHHGIETVDERIKKNKNTQGLIQFQIRNTDGKAEIIFSDDGRGLDWEKIREKYIRLHPDAKKPGMKILHSALFMPEFTTATETSMDAGRGVGLSLVKDLIKQYHGTIDMDSSDSGLTITITLPIPK